MKTTRKRTVSLTTLLSYAILPAIPGFIFLAVTLSQAKSGGIDGWSGNPDTNGGSICTACHDGGAVPTVELSGPTVVQAGTTQTYTLTITGGQEEAGGLDVSATDGSLSVSDPGTYLSFGEITQTEPRNADGSGAVSWTFNWTAPNVGTIVTLYGAGNSVNLGMGTNGDNASSDTLEILVMGGAAAGPGESAGPSIDPLLVTGYDDASGDIDLLFETGCETTGNNIYYGPLPAVASLGWSGEVCDIGSGPAFSGFNPGGGSYFFVVVGHKGPDEGSYGKRKMEDGSEAERLPYGANTCGQSQDLTDRCD